MNSPKNIATQNTALEQASELKEAVSPAFVSGLPSFERVRDTFAQLSRHLYIRSPEAMVGSAFRNGLVEAYTEKDHQLFLREFRHDVCEMIERLQRIKIHLAADLCRGSQRVERAPGQPWSEGSREMKQLRSLCWEPAHNEAPHTKKDLQTIVRLYNQMVPDELRLLPSIEVGKSARKAIIDATGAFSFERPLRDELRQQLELVGTVVNHAISDLMRVLRAPLLFPVDELGGGHEQALSRAWNEYRTIVKQLSSVYEQSSWFSPAYNGTDELQRGPKQGRVEPQITDYQRWSISITQDLERTLEKTFFGEKRGDARLESTLTSSGMAALHTIFSFLKVDWNQTHRHRRQAPHVMSVGDIYFEVQSAVDTFCKGLHAQHRLVDPVDTDAVIAQIQKEVPDILFVSPHSNSFEQKMFDLGKLFEALKDETWVASVSNRLYHRGTFYVKEYMNIVIDNTMLGPAASWKRFPFNYLPHFVRIFSFESLVKFAQDGLDFGSAGLVTCIGEGMGGDFKRAVRVSGYGASELTLHRMNLTHSYEHLVSKLQRHNRNTNLLAAELAESVSSDGYVQRVHHPNAPTHPQHAKYLEERPYAGGVFSLQLKSDFDGVGLGGLKAYEFQLFTLALGFEKLIVHFARESGVELNVGSSFGFNNTRIAVYKHLGKALKGMRIEPEIPHLRIAPGTENIKDIKLIAAAIRRANEVFSDALSRGDLFALSSLLVKENAIII